MFVFGGDGQRPVTLSCRGIACAASGSVGLRHDANPFRAQVAIEGVAASCREPPEIPPVFKNLTVFAAQRSAGEAFGFYLAYLGMAMGLGACTAVFYMIALGVFAPAGTPDRLDHTVAQHLGTLICMPYVLVLGLVVAWKKQLGLGGYAIALLGCFIAAFGAGLLGLVPVSWLTTRPAAVPAPVLPEPPPVAD